MDPLDKLVEEVLASARYRGVSPDLARIFAQEELRRGRKGKDLVKAIRNRLHQSVTAYFTRRPSYEEWIAEMETASLAGADALKSCALKLMRAHASTAERLPVFGDFCELLGEQGLTPESSVLDLGCGLAPLSALWWLPPGARYSAVDASRDLTDFLARFFQIAAIAGTARESNLLSFDPGPEEFDLVILLKVLPLLAQVREEAPFELLSRLRAKRFLISFPLRTLGGRKVGMERTYSAFIDELGERCGLSGEKRIVGDELVYLGGKRLSRGPETRA